MLNYIHILINIIIITINIIIIITINIIINITINIIINIIINMIINIIINIINIYKNKYVQCLNDIDGLTLVYYNPN